MSRKSRSKSAPFPGQHEFVRQQTWTDNNYWAPFSMYNRNRISPNESSFRQTPGSQCHGGAAADRDRQSQRSSAWNPFPGPSPSSTIGNTSVAATSTSRGLQRPGPLMDESLMAKVAKKLNEIMPCICECVCKGVGCGYVTVVWMTMGIALEGERGSWAN